MAALERHCARSRSWGFSPAAGTAPAPGRTLSASGLMDPSSRTFVASIEPTDFADGVMALAPSANTVQVSAESVQDLRLHRACSHRVRRRPEAVPGSPGTRCPERAFFLDPRRNSSCRRDAAWGRGSGPFVGVSKVTRVDAALILLGTCAGLGGRLV